MGMDKSRNRAISFRAMTLSDLSHIEIVENSSFSVPWSRQAFYDELVHNQFAQYTVITVNGQVMGYCGCWLIFDEAHITNLAIHPDYRGKGLGEAVLTYVMGMMQRQGVTKMFLEVRVSNQAAQSLYQKLGFTYSGIRHGYYADNQEDAMIMWVTLDEEADRRDTGTGY
jgi:[ribosomal protein S18]-alanine N-acetyltransferase